MPLNLCNTVADHLKNYPDQKFSAREIAEWIIKKFPDECQDKKVRSLSLVTDADLLKQWMAEIGARLRKLQSLGIKITEDRPRKYYFSDKSDSDEVAAVENVDDTPSLGKSETNFGEHRLYPLLSRYLWDEFRVHPKRIDEKRSSNNRGPNGNRWLYPDLVGMQDQGAEWHQEVKECVKQYSDKRTKLWSFEVKLLINRSNVRDCFFQAVSNSSWANYGYLVAAEIEGQDTIKELHMLFAAHGIGLIKLDVENPFESQVLIPAKERVEIDWSAANRLATENKDFLKYVTLVKQFYQTGEARPADWDVPKEVD